MTEVSIEPYKVEINEKARETLDKIRTIVSQDGWVVSDTSDEIKRDSISIEPLIKKTAAKVEVKAIRGDSGSLDVETFKPTHSDQPVEGKVIAQIKLTPYAGDRGRVNDAQGEYQLLSTGKWMRSEPSHDGSLVYINQVSETPDLIGDYLTRTPHDLTGNERRFYPNQGAIRTHIEEALVRYNETHPKEVERANEYYPNNEKNRIDTILATIAGTVNNDRKIPDEDRVVLGFAAETQLAKK